ncbi:protein FAM161A isoform X1 [Peromyscus maniculatus bairdii]|uniref:protein FAM161A isoform X1 n=1 Tax=Peromyscus maniculatus bairdii TaxID=230844 RepID=UPI00042AC270|nr:protein FAM161A isoform X1 [Peromyscus maniculatus bairdii]
MASPHRAARQAAASLHLPVNLTTGARGAQYEHEDPFESLVAAALAAAVEEEQKGMRPARASAGGGSSFPREDEGMTLQDVIDFSDIYHSNEEYFRKLRELKAAHAETMAKLEKMYQDKLNIKDIRPVIIREDSSSVSSGSASEKDCPHPALLVTSLSEPEVGRSPSLSSTSEEELPNLEREAPRGSRMTAYAKELINNMWTGFSVQDYIQHDSDFQTAKKTRRKPKTWVPTVTVPVPFQMTLREQKRREEALRARADLERDNDDDDDVECRRKFRANPVPPCLFLPLYEDLIRQKEERRRTARERNKAALLASQRPFKFIAREEQKQAVREKQLRDLFKSKRKTKRFKARPMPHSIYRSASNDKAKEEELFRNIRMQLRAQELLQNPSWPYRSAGRPLRDPRSPGKPGGKHRCRCLSPDDGDFAENRRKEPSSEHCFLNPSALYKQCGLQESPCDSAKRQKVLADMRAAEENLKETCWPYLSPRRMSPVRSPCAKPRPCLWSPPMPTLSSRGREQAIRKSLEEKKMLEEERNRILTKQKQRMKELQKLLATRVKAYDSHQGLAQMSKSRVNHLRECEKARMKEYRQELEERDEKLQKRPMLFERVAQRNARLAAEKHYSDTLKALGLSEEFVTEKGQGGKVSENITRPEPGSHTSDKESSYEEERENEEESSFLDANSQDSLKESTGDVEESREENSEE